MRRSQRSIWALVLSVLSLLVAGASITLSAITLSELRRVREELGTRRVSAQELEHLWANQPKTAPPVEPSTPKKQIRWNGVCPKYGASSVEKFRASVERDPVLAKRFAGFQWASARTIVLGEPRMVHVTYRQEGRIGWTRKPLALLAGETLVTDGKTTVRSYCCNEIAAGPAAPTELTAGAAQPTELSEGAVPPTELTAGAAQPTELAIAALPPTEIVDGPRSPTEITDPAIRPPPKELSAGPIPPPGHLYAYYTPYGYSYHKGHHHNRVPEPSTIVLLGTGLGSVALLAARRAKKS